MQPAAGYIGVIRHGHDGQYVGAMPTPWLRHISWHYILTPNPAQDLGTLRESPYMMLWRMGYRGGDSGVQTNARVDESSEQPLRRRCTGRKGGGGAIVPASIAAGDRWPFWRAQALK
ncbi:hypothetical protein DF3PB_4540004 [uncultured Defluviicoccus sp.]|uniref:Uncharacterized protein n=1 Tax=metagenome TaxID=256318 RepID=A0A380TH88_9ZZZZ|nr:hypothetical protein DF3PB_4540004 [uncultured Defluviicoccus sp.]